MNKDYFEGFRLNEEITLRKIEIFLSFMETGNLGRTAEALDMSSVSIHRALHSFEDGLGCPLFSHRGRLLRPLETTKLFQSHCQEVIDHLTHAVELTKIAGGVGSPLVKVGTLYSLTIRTLPYLINASKLRRPGIEFELTMGSNEKLLSKLDRNELDLIVIALDEQSDLPSHFEILPLFVDELFLATPAWMKIHTQEAVPLSAFENERFITLAPGFATYEDFRQLFKKADISPKHITEVKDIFSALSLVNAGVGVSILPGRMSAVYPDTVNFIPLQPPCRRSQSITMVFKRSRQHEPNILALVAEGRMFARSLRNK